MRNGDDFYLRRHDAVDEVVGVVHQYKAAPAETRQGITLWRLADTQNGMLDFLGKTDGGTCSEQDTNQWQKSVLHPRDDEI